MYLKQTFLLYKANCKEKDLWKASLVTEIELIQALKSKLRFLIFFLIFWSAGTMWDTLSEGPSGFVRSLEQGKAAPHSWLQCMVLLLCVTLTVGCAYHLSCSIALHQGTWTLEVCYLSPEAGLGYLTL